MESEAALRRIMPHDLEAEQSVIGSMIMNKKAISVVTEILVKDDFYHTQYGTLFQAIVEMFNAGEAVDLVTLQNKLREMDVPEEVASLEYINKIVGFVPSIFNAKDYAMIIRNKAILRALIETGEKIANQCYADNEPVEDIMNEAEKNIFRIIQSRRNTDFTPIKDIVMETLRHIDQVSKTKTLVTGIPTGFSDLDNKTAGLQNSDLILIAARPSMGKTSLMLNIAEHVALRENKCVALFSLEMPKEQIVNRLFSLESRVDMQKIRTGNLRDSEWDELIESAEVIGQSKLIIDDTPGITVQELRSKCRKFKLDFGLSLVIIDYLQQMGGSGKANTSRQQEISDISRALKALARELQVPVIALSQLSRAVEQRPDHRPMLSDLRESGAIEQDADVVMFIYREEYYKPDSEKRGTADVIIAKQRNGPIGTVSLAWLPQFTRFANLERSPRE